MKALRQVVASNGVPDLQMSSVGSHSISERKEEIKKEMIVGNQLKNSIITSYPKWRIIMKTKFHLRNLLAMNEKINFCNGFYSRANGVSVLLKRENTFVLLHVLVLN